MPHYRGILLRGIAWAGHREVDILTGWFRGVNNQALVHGRFGKKRGVLLGRQPVVEGLAGAGGIDGLQRQCDFD